MPRKPKERHIWAPESYPPVHDCNRQDHGGRWPGACDSVSHPGERWWRCEIPVCPPADLPGAVYWVGEERELWTRGADLGRGFFEGLYTASGELLPWRERALPELIRRGARICYLPPTGQMWPAMVRADIGASLVRADELPAQVSLFR